MESLGDFEGEGAPRPHGAPNSVSGQVFSALGLEAAGSRVGLLYPLEREAVRGQGEKGIGSQGSEAVGGGDQGHLGWRVGFSPVFLKRWNQVWNACRWFWPLDCVS